MTIIFIHGLDSSSKATTAPWFKEHFPAIVIPDFTGSLDNRMGMLSKILSGMEKVVLIGSSFGGLMATIYALENESRVKKVHAVIAAGQCSALHRTHQHGPQRKDQGN